MDSRERRQREIELMRELDQDRGPSPLAKALPFVEYESQLRERFRDEQIKRLSLPENVVQDRNSNFSGLGR